MNSINSEKSQYTHKTPLFHKYFILLYIFFSDLYILFFLNQSDRYFFAIPFCPMSLLKLIYQCLIGPHTTSFWMMLDDKEKVMRRTLCYNWVLIRDLWEGLFGILPIQSAFFTFYIVGIDVLRVIEEYLLFLFCWRENFSLWLLILREKLEETIW